MKLLLKWLGTAAILNVVGHAAGATEPAKAPSEARSIEFVELTSSSEDQGQGQAPGRPSPIDRMRERLADPKEAPALRAEQRAHLAEYYVDTEYALGIDAPTREKLLDLLVDKQLADQRAHTPANRKHPENLQMMLADAETKHLSALRELLGDEGFDRFFAYQMTVGDRAQVHRFDKQLDPSNKLQPDQKERLIELLSAERRQSQDATQSSLSRLVLPPPPVSAEEMRRTSMLLTIESNEETWRNMPEVHQRLARQAAAFLTPPQLAAFDELNAEQMRTLQQWVEQARSKAGLNPLIPATSDITVAGPIRKRTPIDGMVKVDFTVHVNRNEPVRVSHVGSNGKSVTFDAGDGLFIEATPTLYEDHWLDVKTKYYERDADGKLRNIGTGSYGTLTRLPNGMAAGGGGGGGMLTGSKGYSIMETATAAVQPR
jgi:hypothetical protein